MRTLVLNAGYEPLAVITFRRALVLVLTVRPRGIGWYFLFLAGFSVVVAFGAQTPVFELLFHYLPGFNKFRVAARTLFVLNFAVGFLTAEAVDAAMRSIAGRRPATA